MDFRYRFIDRVMSIHHSSVDRYLLPKWDALVSMTGFIYIWTVNGDFPRIRKVGTYTTSRPINNERTLLFLEIKHTLVLQLMTCKKNVHFVYFVSVGNVVNVYRRLYARRFKSIHGSGWRTISREIFQKDIAHN